MEKSLDPTPPYPLYFTEVCGTNIPASDVPGKKNDNGKPRWSLLPWREVSQVVDVLTHGATEYDDYNWQRVEGARNRYFNAAMRHFTAWLGGEKLDPKSKLPHLAHLVCNVLFLLWFDNEEVDK